jgi:dihydrofolate reductase
MGIYQAGLKISDKLYLTRIDGQFLADTFFPAVNWSNWVERSAIFHPANDQNPYSFTIFIYERKMENPTIKPQKSV